MSTTIHLTADVPADHKLTITLPDEIPAGPAEIVMIVASHKPAELSTLSELAESEFFGLWRNRQDIGDSDDFARDLRNRAWSH